MFERGIERLMTYFTGNLTREEDEVRAELARQDAKWGEQNHQDGTGGPAFTAWASAARRMCQRAAADDSVTWQLILDEEVAEAFAEDDPDKLLAELVQVEAVARQWRMTIRRRLAAQQSGEAATR
ncbi:hypothetical protein ACGFNP_25485 [Nonomuraea sp. NPDC049269]|uniref:hypothetical protein n=1 Tax=Nonomuraea sp. NPDC049269 TaxID=3364349 RepID=UPI00372421B4